MPKARLSVPHWLPPSEAAARVQKLLSEHRAQFGVHLTELREVWSGQRGEFSFRYMGFAVSGVIEVLPETVDVEISFPLVGLPFKAKFESKFHAIALSALSSQSPPP